MGDKVKNDNRHSDINITGSANKKSSNKRNAYSNMCEYT